MQIESRDRTFTFSHDRDAAVMTQSGATHKKEGGPQPVSCPSFIPNIPPKQNEGANSILDLILDATDERESWAYSVSELRIMRSIAPRPILYLRIR